MPDSGGTYQSCKHFFQALGAWCQFDTISFTSIACNVDKRTFPIHDVPVVDSFAGRYYLWSAKKNLVYAESVLAGADLIFIHMLYRYHSQWASNFAMQHGIPTVIVPHGSLDPYVFTYRCLQKKAWLRIVGRKILDNASAILCATEREREKAKQHVGSTPSKIISWPISFGPFDCTIDVRSILGIPPSDRILLFVGRLHPVKRPIETIDAFVTANIDGWHLILVGPGSSELPLNEVVLYANGCSRVHVVGAQFGESKNAFIHSADMYILFSKKENYSYTVAEAIQARVPVMISREVDLSPVVERYACGIVVDAITESSRRDAIKSLESLRNSNFNSMRDNCDRFSQNELQFSVFEDRLKELVNNTLESQTNTFI